jgi:zinc resistance-associated protein
MTMLRVLLPPLSALSIGAFAFAPAMAAPGESSGPPGMEQMQHWAADHEALLDARVAGLRAGLKLTPDQEKLWPPFETAVRDAAKMRMEQMKAMMDRMQKMRDMDMMQPMQESDDMRDMGPPGQAISPVERLESRAKRMSERGAAMLNVAEAAKPLYASLDDTQKRLFGMLGGEMLLTGHGQHRGMGMMGGMGKGMTGGGMGMMGGMGRGTMGGCEGMMGEGGMGMMGREPGSMDRMGNERNDDEGGSDE